MSSRSLDGCLLDMMFLVQMIRRQVVGETGMINISVSVSVDVP